jgi:hypothetical protein
MEIYPLTGDADFIFRARGIENAQHYRSGDSHKDLKSNVISAPGFVGGNLVCFC